jgi:hypothetical protein
MLRMINTNTFVPGTRVRYTGKDTKLVGVEGTIVLYNNLILIDWDNGYNSVVKNIGGQFEIIDHDSTKDSPKEKPCKVCSKVNDMGVKSCWWCSCSNPTD